MDELKIYGRHTSYNVQKVLWLADELKLSYRHIETGGRFGGTDSAEFIRMNPMGKVPVLAHGENVVWESNTIVRYLAHSFGKDIWISSTPFQRSQEERWMDWSIEKLEPAFTGVFWGYYRTPADDRDEIAIIQSVADCELCLSKVEKQLANSRFLVRDVPTVADIAVGVYLHRLHSIDVDITFPQPVKIWYEDLAKRAGYKRWVMSDFTELFGRSEY